MIEDTEPERHGSKRDKETVTERHRKTEDRDSDRETKDRDRDTDAGARSSSPFLFPRRAAGRSVQEHRPLPRVTGYKGPSGRGEEPRAARGVPAAPCSSGGGRRSARSGSSLGVRVEALG